MKHYLTIIFLLSIVSISFGQKEEAHSAFNEGLNLLKAEKFAEAEEQFTTAIGLLEQSEPLKMAHIYRGFSLNGMSKYEEAILDFNLAIELDPNDPATLIDRANTFLYLNNIEEAVDDFKKILTLDDKGERAQTAYYYLGRIAFGSGEFEESISYFDTLIEMVPNEAECYFIRGTAKSNLMDHEGAISDYDLAIKHNPEYMEAYANRGTSKMNTMPVEDKVGKKAQCLEEPCKDLLQAKRMGDSSVDELVYIYCKKCNFESKK